VNRPCTRGRLVITRLGSNSRVHVTCQSAHELGHDIILVKDGQSTYHGNLKATSDYHNGQLNGECMAGLQPTANIKFEPANAKLALSHERDGS